MKQFFSGFKRRSSSGRKSSFSPNASSSNMTLTSSKSRSSLVIDDGNREMSGEGEIIVDMYASGQALEDTRSGLAGSTLNGPTKVDRGRDGQADRGRSPADPSISSALGKSQNSIAVNADSGSNAAPAVQPIGSKDKQSAPPPPSTSKSKIVSGDTKGGDKKSKPAGQTVATTSQKAGIEESGVVSRNVRNSNVASLEEQERLVQIVEEAFWDFNESSTEDGKLDSKRKDQVQSGKKKSAPGPPQSDTSAAVTSNGGKTESGGKAEIGGKMGNGAREEIILRAPDEFCDTSHDESGGSRSNDVNSSGKQNGIHSRPEPTGSYQMKSSANVLPTKRASDNRTAAAAAAGATAAVARVSEDQPSFGRLQHWKTESALNVTTPPVNENPLESKSMFDIRGNVKLSSAVESRVNQSKIRIPDAFVKQVSEPTAVVPNGHSQPPRSKPAVVLNNAAVKDRLFKNRLETLIAGMSASPSPSAFSSVSRGVNGKNLDSKDAAGNLASDNQKLDVDRGRRPFKFLVEGIDIPETSTTMSDSLEELDRIDGRRDPSERRGFSYIIDKRLAAEISKRAADVTSRKPHEAVESKFSERERSQERSGEDEAIRSAKSKLHSTHQDPVEGRNGGLFDRGANSLMLKEIRERLGKPGGSGETSMVNGGTPTHEETTNHPGVVIRVSSDSADSSSSLSSENTSEANDELRTLDLSSNRLRVDREYHGIPHRHAIEIDDTNDTKYTSHVTRRENNTGTNHDPRSGGRYLDDSPPSLSVNVTRPPVAAASTSSTFQIDRSIGRSADSNNRLLTVSTARLPSAAARDSAAVYNGWETNANKSNVIRPGELSVHTFNPRAPRSGLDRTNGNGHFYDVPDGQGLGGQLGSESIEEDYDSSVSSLSLDTPTPPISTDANGYTDYVARIGRKPHHEHLYRQKPEVTKNSNGSNRNYPDFQIPNNRNFPFQIFPTGRTSTNGKVTVEILSSSFENEAPSSLQNNRSLSLDRLPVDGFPEDRRSNRRSNVTGNIITFSNLPTWNNSPHETHYQRPSRFNKHRHLTRHHPRSNFSDDADIVSNFSEPEIVRSRYYSPLPIGYRSAQTTPIGQFSDWTFITRPTMRRAVSTGNVNPVFRPPSSVPTPDVTGVDPELEKVAKRGSQYNIQMRLNAIHGGYYASVTDFTVAPSPVIDVNLLRHHGNTSVVTTAPLVNGYGHYNGNQHHRGNPLTVQVPAVERTDEGFWSPGTGSGDSYAIKSVRPTLVGGVPADRQQPLPSNKNEKIEFDLELLHPHSTDGASVRSKTEERRLVYESDVVDSRVGMGVVKNGSHIPDFTMKMNDTMTVEYKPPFTNENVVNVDPVPVPVAPRRSKNRTSGKKSSHKRHVYESIDNYDTIDGALNREAPHSPDAASLTRNSRRELEQEPAEYKHSLRMANKFASSRARARLPDPPRIEEEDLGSYLSPEDDVIDDRRRRHRQRGPTRDLGRHPADVPKVVRGSILIRNSMDRAGGARHVDVIAQDDPDSRVLVVPDNANMFHGRYFQRRENPLYSSDPDLSDTKTTPRRDGEDTVDHRQFRGRPVPVEIFDEHRVPPQFDFVDDFDTEVVINRDDQFSRRARRNKKDQSGNSGSRDFTQNEIRSTTRRPMRPTDHRIKQTVDVQREEEELIGPLEPQTEKRNGLEAMLNVDMVSEKVDLDLTDGITRVTVKVRCERVVPIRGTSDMFKKSAVVVTRVVEVDMLATEERRDLFDAVMASARPSGATGGSTDPRETRLSTKDTFELYKMLMKLADADEDGRIYHKHFQIDKELEEEKRSPYKSGVRDVDLDGWIRTSHANINSSHC